MIIYANSADAPVGKPADVAEKTQKNLRQCRVSRHQPCPVCQKTTGCLVLDHSVVCLRVPSERPAQGGLGGWVHSHQPEQLYQAARQVFVQPATRLASPEVLDRVYRALHSQLFLTPLHQKHLTQERQLSLDAIKARGYLSWGQGDRLQRSALAQNLYDLFGGLVLDVPGLLVREQSRTYLTMAGPSGILIPVRDTKNQIVAHQIRTDQPGHSGKYVWLSSASRGGPSPGSPIHVSRPLFSHASTRVWLTEGPLKADIASERLQEIVLALPGIQADKHFLTTLQTLQERQEITELVIALDSDHHEKPAVAGARLKLAEKAARQGIPVWLADWPSQLKGLDDLLLAGGQPRLTPFQVSGNGKRPFEEEPQVRPPVAPSVPLEQARKELKNQLLKAFQGDYGDLQTLGILVSPLPGTGKSTILSEVLNQVHKNRTTRRSSAYFVPRHNLAETRERKAWAFLSGRTRADATTGQTPCAFPHAQKQMNLLRIPSQMGCDSCALQTNCKSNQQPNSQNEPYYWGQFQQAARVKTYPAQHFLSPSLWGRHLSVVLDDCDLKSLMLDELFLTQSQLGYALDWATKHLNHTYSKAQPLLFLLYELLRCAPAGQAFCSWGPDLLQDLETLAQKHRLDLEKTLKDAEQAEEPDPFQDRTLRDGPRAVPVRFLSDLVRVLLFEWQQAQNGANYNRRLRLERVHSGGEVGFRLTQRRELPVSALSESLLILSDASLTLSEAQYLFPDRRWIELKPNLKIPAAAQIIQRPEYNYGKVHLSNPQEREKALLQIGQLLEQHRGARVGLISHQSFASVAKQRFPQLKTGYYYGQRGSNEFIDCDVLIVFGTPNPNPNELERQAEALYWDQEVLRTQTMLEPRSFQQRNQATLKTRVRAYADPRLQEMLRGKREEELLQAIFRARPLSLDPNYHQQGLLDFEPQLRAERQQVTIYVFSALPLPALDVQLQTTAPVQNPPADVIPIERAARQIWRQQQRLTDQRLLQAAHVQNQALLAWKDSLSPYEVETAHPPSQAPPDLN